MSLQNETRNVSHHDVDDAIIEVAAGVPTDRVRWPAIIAGTFAALTALAILGTLGVAIGLSSYDQGQDNPRNFAMGYGIWGIISTIVAFALGGFLTARVAALRGRDDGLLNGMMVGAFGLPLLMFLIGSAGALVGHAELTNDRVPARTDTIDTDSAVTASARMPADNASADRVNAAKDKANAEPTRRTASRTAWGTLFAMVLALGAASFGGYTGSGLRDDHSRDVRRRRTAVQ
jgi:hypothetical protein